MKPNLVLRPFQEQCIWEMLHKKRGLIALPTGTGKTITSFSIFSYLKSKFPDIKLLYITDKTLIPQTANQDLPTYFKLNQLHIYNHTKQEREAIYQTWTAYPNQSILIINYHTLRNDFSIIGNYLKKINLNFITILDEATAFKNTTSQIYNCITLLSKVAKRTYALTATPSTSGLYDTYNILNAIQLPPYRSKQEFETHHCKTEAKKMCLIRNTATNQKRMAFPIENPKNKTSLQLFFSIRNQFKIFTPIKILSYPNVGHFKQLSQNNGSFCWTIPKPLQTKTSILATTTNPKTDKTKKIHLQLSLFDNRSFAGYKNISLFRQQTQKTMFIRSKKEIAKELPPITILYRYTDTSKEQEQVIKQLYKNENYSASQIEIALVSPQSYSESVPQDYVSPKLETLLHYIQNDIQDEKCIIFFPYTQGTDTICNILNQNEISNIQVTGEVKNRDEALREFLDSDIRCLVGTTTILKGLNLQSIDNLIVLHPTNTFGNYLQLIGRINRIGATNPKTVVHILTRESRDIDLMESVYQQGSTIYKLNPKLIDEGVLPKKYYKERGMTEQQAKQFLEKQLEARRAVYLNTNKHSNRTPND